VTPTLEAASNSLIAAAMAMQGADATPTSGQVAAATKARTDANAAIRRWNSLKTTGLSAVNAKRKAAGQPAITMP
jgi:hypothetical protein